MLSHLANIGSVWRAESGIELAEMTVINIVKMEAGITLKFCKLVFP